MRECLGRVFGGASGERWSSRQESEATRKFLAGNQVKVIVDGAVQDRWVVIRDDSSRPNKNDWIIVGVPHDPDPDQDRDFQGFAQTMEVSREKLMEWNQKEVK